MKLFDYQDRKVNVSDLMQKVSATLQGSDAGTSSDANYGVTLPQWFQHLQADSGLQVPSISPIPEKTRFRGLKLIVDRLIRFHTREQYRFNSEVKQTVEQLFSLFDAQTAQINAALGKLHREQVGIENAIRDLAASIENVRIEFSARLSFRPELEAAIRDLASSIENVRIEFNTQMNHFHPAQTLERLAVLERDVRRLSEVANRLTESPRPVDRKVQKASVKSQSVPSVKVSLAAGGFDYYRFELRFRGSEAEIKQRQKQYARYFEGRQKVVDLACGRGEFLEVLREMGQTGTGVDLSSDNVLLGQSKGLNVVQAEALEYLRSLENESLDGIFTAQFVEHLTTDQFLELNRLVFAKLKPEGVFIAETINPATLAVHARSLYMDLTHQKPIHPVTFQFLLESLRYQKVDLLFSSPVEDKVHIPHLPGPTEPRASASGPSGSDEAVSKFNQAVDALNELLYGAQDYAVVAVK